MCLSHLTTSFGIPFDIQRCVVVKFGPSLQSFTQRDIRRVFHIMRAMFRATRRCLSAALPERQLIVFDTTLRDGEQSPGCTLNTKEKLAVARQLSRLGVDVCEAGFPIASDGDFEAVSIIADQIGPLTEGRSNGPMTICGLSRATEKDIKRCHEAVKHAPKHRIHTFLATSDIHLKHKLMIDRDECVKRAVAAVAFARSLTPDVEFSPEDAGRSDPDFLCRVLAAVIEAGATTLNIPDTVGYNTPSMYGNLIQYLVENTRGAEQAIFSTHCHNDLGLATANTLSGVLGGARQVEVTINGIGERAGNTSLEEVCGKGGSLGMKDVISVWALRVLFGVSVKTPYKLPIW